MLRWSWPQNTHLDNICPDKYFFQQPDSVSRTGEAANHKSGTLDLIGSDLRWLSAKVAQKNVPIRSREVAHSRSALSCEAQGIRLPHQFAIGAPSKMLTPRPLQRNPFVR